MDKMDEICLCVDANAVRALTGPTGFGSAADFPLWSVLRLVNTTATPGVPVMMPRRDCETDERFKHFATYTLVNSNGRVLAYRRGGSGAEARLRNRWSVGVGGHVNDLDVECGVTEESIYRAAGRELCEEVLFDGMVATTEYTPGLLWNPRFRVVYRGLLSDDSDAVGRVHAGLVFECVTAATVTTNEDDLDGFAFLSVPELAADPDRFEGWSKILIGGVLCGDATSVFHQHELTR